MGIKSAVQHALNVAKAMFTLDAAAGSGDGTRWVFIGGTRLSSYEIHARDLIVAYWACRRNIAEDMALMPFRILKYQGRLKTPQRSDPLAYLLNVAPNPAMSAFSFRATLAGHWLDYGTAFAHIQWNRMTGKPAAIWPVHPNHVRFELRPTPLNPWNLDYWIKNPKTGVEFGPVPQSDILKVPGFSDDGLLGFSMFKVLMNTLSTAWSTQEVTRNFFDNNAVPGGVLESTQTVGKTERQALEEHWKEYHAGAKNAGKVLVLGSGLSFKTLSQNFKDADLVALRSLSIQEIATGFRMPLRKLQIILNAQGWATLDAQEADYTTSCLAPNVKRFEEEIQRQLMGEIHGYSEDEWAHFEMKGRLRGDLKSRMEFYKTMFFLGAITPNEIRELEDMNPILTPEGTENPMDKTYIQGATVPIEMAGMMQAAGVNPNPPKPGQENEDQERTNEEVRNRLARLETSLANRN